MINFRDIYVEARVISNDHTQIILSKLGNPKYRLIDRISDVFDNYKKSFNDKSHRLNLFIGIKDGLLIKKTPPDYGLSDLPHYYFSTNVNCIFECEYCFLQGYFNSPDVILYVNHHDIAQQIKSSSPAFFHSGEFGDSIALSEISCELPYFFELFNSLPSSYLELRTKCGNIKELLKLKPADNIYTTFTLSPPSSKDLYEPFTPTIDSRIKAIVDLLHNGFKVAVHFDPIIYSDNYISEYEKLILQIPLRELSYMSLGVVRFTKKAWKHVQQNYPNSYLLAQPFEDGDNKVSYRKDYRIKILDSIKSLCITHGMNDKNIFYCMENPK